MKSVVENARGLPEGVDVYLFGSARDHGQPNDIDMLFIYDSTVVPCDNAYHVFLPLVRAVQNKLGIPVHAVVLSAEEARNTRFIDMVAPMRLRSTFVRDVP